MKPSLIRSEIGLLKEKLKNKIRLIGAKNVANITETKHQNIYSFLRGDLDYSYKKILEWCDLFNIQ